jgi:hypothetical protein
MKNRLAVSGKLYTRCTQFARLARSGELLDEKHSRRVVGVETF